jgi:beta-glucosidase
MSPQILDGDGIERTAESDEDKALLRKLAAESIVLLKNDNNLLPLQPQNLKKIAIVGGNAQAVILSGGGSAALKPSYFISPYQGIVNALPSHVEVTYGEGASSMSFFDKSKDQVANHCIKAYMEMPTLDFELTTPSGERGWIGTWYAHESDESMTPVRTPMETRLVDKTRIFISTSAPNGITRRWTMKLEGQLKPRARDCTFEFGLTASGRAKVDTPFPTVVYAILTRSPSSSLSTASWSLITGRASVVGTHSSIAARKRRRVGSTLKRA